MKKITEYWFEILMVCMAIFLVFGVMLGISVYANNRPVKVIHDSGECALGEPVKGL